jgi:hypothetical protein
MTRNIANVRRSENRRTENRKSAEERKQREQAAESSSSGNEGWSGPCASRYLRELIQ